MLNQDNFERTVPKVGYIGRFEMAKGRLGQLCSWFSIFQGEFSLLITKMVVISRQNNRY